MALNLKHQTLAEFAARLREKYRGATRLEAMRLAKWIQDRTDAGELTDLQLRTAFGLAAGPWATLKARMISHRSNYDAVQAAGGE